MGSSVGGRGLLNITTQQPVTPSTALALSFLSRSLRFHSMESAGFSALVKASRELKRKIWFEAKTLKAEMSVAYT